MFFSNCNGNGVCNSLNECHCNEGWLPPFCEVTASTGSNDGDDRTDDEPNDDVNDKNDDATDDNDDVTDGNDDATDDNDDVPDNNDDVTDGTTNDVEDSPAANKTDEQLDLEQYAPYMAIGGGTLVMIILFAVTSYFACTFRTKKPPVRRPHPVIT